MGYRRGWLSRSIDALIMLPLGTSAVIVGFGFLVALDTPPLDLRTSILLIPIAHSLIALPFVMRAVVPVIRSIDDRLREAAAVLGASPARAWREVDAPILARAALVGAGFAFAISLGEFGATLFIARPDTRHHPGRHLPAAGPAWGGQLRHRHGAGHGAHGTLGRGRAAHRATPRPRAAALLGASDAAASRGLVAAYEGEDILRGLDLDVPAGQLLCVLGPSGGGKSTLLRAVAGLEEPRAGSVHLDGHDLAGVPAHERGVGLMFQDYALFPHRDVGDNVAFGLRMRGARPEAVRARVRELLELVGLPGAERRPVDQLSGGEQQRVALARALAPQPRLLMLDEPMGSLDRALRERLPEELRAIFADLGLTTIYVTHDQDEALSVADRVVILEAGRLIADGTPEQLWLAPPSAWVARFLGFRNVARGRSVGGRLETPWGSLLSDSDGAGDAADAGDAGDAGTPVTPRRLGRAFRAGRSPSCCVPPAWWPQRTGPSAGTSAAGGSAVTTSSTRWLSRARRRSRSRPAVASGPPWASP